MRKKLLSLPILLLFVLSILGVSMVGVSSVDSPAVYVEPATVVSPDYIVGVLFTVAIKTDYTGHDVTSYQFTLAYNPDILEGIEVTNGDLIVGGSAQFISGRFNNTAGEISLTVGFFFEEGEVTSGPGILANVTFTVVGIGTSDIKIGPETKLIGWDVFELKEYNIIDAETMPTHILHGYFCNTEELVTHDIAVVSVTPYPTSVKLGELVNITIVVENQGTAAETFDITVYYDDTAIKTETVPNLAAGTNTSLTFTWNTTNTREEIYATTHKEKAYTINATATIASDEDPDDNTLVSPCNVKVISQYIAVIPQSTVDPNLTPGMNYTVSIYTDYDGSDVWSYQFTLSYNPNVLEGVEVVNGDLITTDKDPSARFEAGAFNNTLGELLLTVAWFFYIPPAEPYVTSGPGTLANVTFRVKDAGDSNIILVEKETKIIGPKAEYDIVNHYLPSFNHILHGYFRSTEAQVIHDIAVVSVTPYPTSVKLGELVNITIVVENQGTAAETFDITVWYDYAPKYPDFHVIETKTAQNLATGAIKTLTFAWDTTAVTAGNYTITAVVSELPGEADTDDNTLESEEMVTVTAREETPLPITELVIGIVAVVVVIAVVMYALKRRKKPP